MTINNITISLEDIRFELAEHDVDNIYKNRELFDIFLDGCLGWNNIPLNECIEYYVNCFYSNKDYETITFFVTENDTTYKVVKNGDIDNIQVTKE